jgi:hypothetical protein
VKRSIVIFLVVILAAALAGWAAGRVRVAFLERRASRLVEDQRAAAEAAAKIPAGQIAALIREADEVVISYSVGSAAGENVVTFNDPAWRSEFAGVIARASFVARAHAMWTSTPTIRFRRRHEEILELMGLGNTLRAFGQQVGGDFIVGAETARAIHGLIQQKRPDQPSEPWRGYGL